VSVALSELAEIVRQLPLGKVGSQTAFRRISKSGQKGLDTKKADAQIFQSGRKEILQKGRSIQRYGGINKVQRTHIGQVGLIKC